jgi:formylglycine-generating enzyme required for sulfatase activity
MLTRKALFVFAVLIVVYILVACQPAAATATLTFTPYISPTPEPLKPTSYPVEITDPKDVDMLLVPAGEFLMGSDADDALAECEKYHNYCQRNRYENEEPPHIVYLDTFYIDKYEVTNGLFAACVQVGVCQSPKDSRSMSRSSYYGNPQYEDYPVIHVDWNMAEAYCEWRGARLPSEAEWEKAARGTDGRTYPWGEGVDCSYANHGGGNNMCVGDTSPVGSYESGRSFYGAYDMAGNVWEWVSSLYEPYPYNPDDGREDLSASGSRVMRGGSWHGSELHLRTACRSSVEPLILVGFRCARDISP